MKSLNENGVSTCVAGKRTMCISILCPDYARKAGIANTTTAMKRIASYSVQLPRHWKYVGSAEMNG